MKNVRVKVVERCAGNYWRYAICDGRKQLFLGDVTYEYKANAIRFAKKMAKRIGIPYNTEIIKRGC